MSLTVIVLIIILLIFGLLIISTHNRPKYDERQTLIRNKSFKLAFSTTVAIDVIFFLLINYLNIKIPANFLLIAPFMIGMIVSTIYSLVKGAYVAINEKHLKSDGIISLITGLLNALTSISGLTNDPSNWSPNVLLLLMSLYFIIIGVAELYLDHANRSNRAD